MKKINVILMVCAVLVTISAFAQQSSKNSLSEITPDSLSIGYSKTTNIVFPYAIKSVDRGSGGYLGSKSQRP